MYSIDIQRNFPNEETWFLQATLLEDGRPFASVSNRGTGGCHIYRPINEDYATFREDMERFEQYADLLPMEFDSEKNDQYVDSLINEWYDQPRTVLDLLTIGWSQANIKEMSA